MIKNNKILWIFYCLGLMHFFMFFPKNKYSKNTFKKKLMYGVSIAAIGTGVLLWMHRRNQNKKINDKKDHNTRLINNHIVDNSKDSLKDKIGSKVVDVLSKDSTFMKKIKGDPSLFFYMLDGLYDASFNDSFSCNHFCFSNNNRSMKNNMFIDVVYVEPLFFYGFYLGWFKESIKIDPVYKGYLDLLIPENYEKSLFGKYINILDQKKSNDIGIKNSFGVFIEKIKLFKEEKKLSFYSTVLLSKPEGIGHYVAFGIDKEKKTFYILNSLNKVYFTDLYLQEIKNAVSKEINYFSDYRCEYIDINLQTDGVTCGIYASVLAKVFAHNGLDGVKQFLSGLKNKKINNYNDIDYEKLKTISIEENILKIFRGNKDQKNFELSVLNESKDHILIDGNTLIHNKKFDVILKEKIILNAGPVFERCTIEDDNDVKDVFEYKDKQYLMEDILKDDF